MSTSKNHSSGKANRSSLSGKDKVSVAREYGEGLVGSRIRVWWPLDRKFYEGVVDSYASSKKKHRVLYDDGDEETLDMKKERWELIEEDKAVADEDDSADESSDATPEPLNRKKAISNGKVSENGRKDDAIPKKKQKIDSSAKSKSKARPGKKPEGSEEERLKTKSSVKKEEKSKDDVEQTPKPTERNGSMGDIGGKIVAAASRMSGRFQGKENGLEKDKTKTLNSSKVSDSNNSKHKRPSSSSEAVSEKVKKPKTSSKKIVSNNTDEEDGEDDKDDDASDEESRPLVSYLKKPPEAIEALMEKMKRKKKKEAGEGSSGNEAKAVEESS